jgi:hypothetical protein
VTSALDQLTVAGACQLIVAEKGTQVYYFAEFESEEVKRSDELSKAAHGQKIAPH